MISNQETITKMQELRLHGMARAFQRALEAGLEPRVTPDELLAHLIDAE